MNATSDSKDPRSQPDFNEAWLPLCDGAGMPPVATTVPQLRRVIEFAAIYYAMNRSVARAEAARGARDDIGEIVALKDLRSASHERDALEDRYAAEGFLAEPVMDGSRYANLLFTWAGKESPTILVRKCSAEFSF